MLVILAESETKKPPQSMVDFLEMIVRVVGLVFLQGGLCCSSASMPGIGSAHVRFYWPKGLAAGVSGSSPAGVWSSMTKDPPADEKNS
jgi:hypothetical protein